MLPGGTNKRRGEIYRLLGEKTSGVGKNAMFLKFCGSRVKEYVF